ncbi:hypothetical protein BH10ACT10_BH10ACT10_01850 [soil metagenome]
MRSFLAGLALFLAFVTGTIALSAYVAETTLLDPSRAGTIVAKSLGRSDVREELLSRAVPGYDRLDASTKARVDDAARSASARRALDRVRLSDDGTLRLDSLHDAVASELRANGQSRAARRVEASNVGEVTLPARYTNKLADARTTARDVWQKGGLAAVVLAAVALLVSKRRVRTLGSVGLTVLLCCAATAGLAWLLPTFVRAASSDPLVGVGASVLRSEWTTTLTAMLPVAVVGAALFVLGLFGARNRG